MKNLRSYEKITKRDLKKLAQISAKDRGGLFSRKPHLAPLANEILCTVLCQGAALHFVNGKNGVKDFDVWTFYRKVGGVKFFLVVELGKQILVNLNSDRIRSSHLDIKDDG